MPCIFITLNPLFGYYYLRCTIKEIHFQGSEVPFQSLFSQLQGGWDLNPLLLDAKTPPFISFTQQLFREVPSRMGSKWILPGE